MFHWFQNRRRAQILAPPFPPAWQTFLENNMGFYRRLDDSERAKLQDITRIMVAEKNWEGHAGLEMCDEIKVTVAGMAALMLLGVDNFFFEKVRTIILFPQAVRRETNTGWVIERDTFHSGEAHPGGQVVLSWQDSYHDAQAIGNGHNLVLHEFAHCLDNLDGEMGGSLDFGDRETNECWNQVCEREFQALIHAVQNGQRTLINDYGATNKAEFFAVCTETFFEKPLLMEQQHTELFQLLARFYRLDPRKWFPG
ncbi:MAG: zinc-dependent peptidase [Mariniblastus sp.]|nr:zinc-dependent peptidase [Mariniblastus sp.]